MASDEVLCLFQGGATDGNKRPSRSPQPRPTFSAKNPVNDQNEADRYCVLKALSGTSLILKPGHSEKHPYLGATVPND